jgi:hypothetical protein
MSMRHNKKRNTALLYEFLMRHISTCLLENKKAEAQKALELTKKYFANGTPLHQELVLFKAITENTFKSKDSAQKILDGVYTQAKKINARQLDEHKSKLIRDINHTFNTPTIYDYKVPNYAVYASVQTVLNEARVPTPDNKGTLNFVDKAKLEDTILTFLIREDKDPVVQQLKTNPQYSHAVYKFAFKRFQEKYDKALTEDQKKLLTKYAVYLMSENKTAFKSAIQKEVETIKEKLRNVRDETVLRDNDLKNKITECYKKLVSTNLEEINDENIMQILQYMSLVNEVYSQ